MSAFKGTPGPWRIVPREVLEDSSVYPAHVVGGPRDLEVCHLEARCVAQLAIENPGSFWGDSPAKKANARLIAAAPELLEAAQRSAAALRSGGIVPSATSDNPIEWLLHQTEAAIAKAIGGPA